MAIGPLRALVSWKSVQESRLMEEEVGKLEKSKVEARFHLLAVCTTLSKRLRVIKHLQTILP